MPQVEPEREFCGTSARGRRAPSGGVPGSASPSSQRFLPRPASRSHSPSSICCSSMASALQLHGHRNPMPRANIFRLESRMLHPRKGAQRREVSGIPVRRSTNPMEWMLLLHASSARWRLGAGTCSTAGDSI